MIEVIMAIQQTTLERFLPIIVIIVGTVIGFLVWFYRDTLFDRGPSKTAVDKEIEQYLDRIRQLARSHNYRDASLLVWETFNAAAWGFMGYRRDPAQSARRFAMSFTQQPNVDPSAVMQVVELFERARYSDEDITTTQWNEGLGGLHRFLQTATAMREQLDEEELEERISEEY